MTALLSFHVQKPKGKGFGKKKGVYLTSADMLAFQETNSSVAFILMTPFLIHMPKLQMCAASHPNPLATGERLPASHIHFRGITLLFTPNSLSCSYCVWTYWNAII